MLSREPLIREDFANVRIIEEPKLGIDLSIEDSTPNDENLETCLQTKNHVSFHFNKLWIVTTSASNNNFNKSPRD